MKLLGFEITRARAEQKSLAPVYPRNTFWGFVRESFAGAWQTNVTVSRDEILAYFAVYSCISLIAQDISKMRLKLVQKTSDGIWEETDSPAFSPVLRKPNHFQTRIKFIEYWITSKLVHGNAYILKQRNNRGNVEAMYVLDPMRVTPLISESGEVFYQVRTDTLSGLVEVGDVVIPAREIIHDTGICIFHPLVGVSPVYACGVAATQGLKIQNNSTNLFTNMSRPSGILTAPGAISDETAARLKADWETNFSGDNVGKTAVLGDGLAYQAMTITPEDAQLVEQLKMSAEVVCSTFHVPPYMIGVGALPSYNNIEALNQQYYSQALQAPIEAAELLIDEGLGLVQAGYGVEFDLENLLRMDTAARYKAHTDAIGGGWLAPNEARKKEDLRPVAGGETPYMQQQNYSLAALAKRDSDDPFAKPEPPALPAPAADGADGADGEGDVNAEDAADEEAKLLADYIIRGLMDEVANA